MGKLRFLDDPAFKCLRSGEVDKFHRLMEGREPADFSGTDLRGTDFRQVDMTKLILRDAYLRDADLRGCDLRNVDLTGATLQDARIAGVYFADNLPADEITMSIRYGTRLRPRVG